MMQTDLTVQADKVLAVPSQDRPPQSDGKNKHILIRDSLIRLPRFQGSHDVMAKDAQFDHNWERKIFVSIQLAHTHQASC